jgi:predicted  nucleic acid-binding Zn ribbon protein
MILAKVNFGRQRELEKRELEDIAESYLISLLKPGQICGEYLMAWTGGILNAHVYLAGPDAFHEQYHSSWGKLELAKVQEAFQQMPEWTVLDDDCPKSTREWKDAPFLYLFTHAFDEASPVSHGGSGRAIPLYTIPVPFEVKEKIYFWQKEYRWFDHFQLGSGVMEIPAYRQMAEPNSELAQKGREQCRQIEAGTGLPTYYYLFRYWGRPKGEADRLCPGCGKAWKVEHPVGLKKPFHHFDFRCDPCRLVSHQGDSTDGGWRVRIGEFRGNNSSR